MVVPAIVFHEVAHGYSAYLLGDPTAKNAGRLTLNPLKHIDPFGTVILPIILLIASGGTMSFGYAKPVPFNPMYFKDRGTGTLITGVAGPVANLALAAVVGVAIGLSRLVGLGADVFSGTVLYLLDYFVVINLMLLFFNMIPIPGLDGSRVVQRFLPPRARLAYFKAERYTMLILFGAIYLMPGAVSAYLRYTVFPVYDLLTLGAGAF